MTSNDTGLWEIYALKYAERNTRTRADSFIMDDHAAAAHGMDYFVWVLRSGERTIVVDTGYDTKEAERRDRPILMDPAKCLSALNISPDAVDTVVLTHLHYDHAGALDQFPNATFHVQETEVAYATGPCMCHGHLQLPYTAEHICTLVKRIYSGRVIFYDGSGEIAPGVRVHRIGGHARGLQALEIMTENGPRILASDATHYYENFIAKKPFPIVVDMEDMLTGFDRLIQLGGTADAVIPGHDPLVRDLFPAYGHSGFVWQLHQKLIKPLPSF